MSGFEKVDLSVSDIEIGAVELKDKDSDARAEIVQASDAKAGTTEVLMIQEIDTTGKVAPAGEAVGNAPFAKITDGTETAAINTSNELEVAPNGNVAHDAADSGNPIKIGGVYNETEPTLDDGDRGDGQMDSGGWLKVVTKAFEAISNTIQATIKNPESAWNFEDELVDTTDLAADDYYYPSSEGFVMGRHSRISCHMVVSGGVTVTVEATNDDAASPDWVDVTETVFDAVAGTDSAANYVDTSAFLYFKEPMQFKKLRYKVVCADAYNAVQLHTKRTV